MTSSGILSYRDLLSLYRGKFSAVEHLPPETRRAMAVATPLVDFLKTADKAGAPKHILLAGNAGDGKSFAALAAETVNFTVILDASQGDSAAAITPIAKLASDITAALAQGKRLLIAINRGQFERLEGFAQKSAAAALRSFLDAARVQMPLRDGWREQERPPDVAFIDLGLLDTASARMLDGILERITRAGAADALHPHTRTALDGAQQALGTPPVRDFLLRLLHVAHARGHHTTPRQLWSFLSYLATGARDVASAKIPTLADAIGARLFDGGAEGVLFDYARDLADPATSPHAVLAKEVVQGSLPSSLRRDLKGLANLQASAADEDGELLTRIALVHGYAPLPPPAAPVFRSVVAQLMSSGDSWVYADQVIEKLLNGIYRSLGLWGRGNSFPAWQTLCFDSAKFRDAASSAAEEIDPARLRLALPRPNPVAQGALEGMWLPPFVWLGTAAAEATRTALRLTPRLFELMYSNSSDQVSNSELLTLHRWLTGLPSDVRRPGPLRLGRRANKVVARFRKDPLLATISVEREDS